MTEKKLKKKKRKISLITWLVIFIGILFVCSNYPGEPPQFQIWGDTLYNHEGLEVLKEKEYKKAIELFNESIKHNKLYAEAYYNRGVAKSRLKDYKGALKDYNKAIDLDSKAKKESAQIKAGDPRYNRTLSGEKYPLLLPLNSLGNVYYNRGIAKDKLNDYTGAIEDYNKTIELDPKNTDAYNSLCKIEALHGSSNEALKDCDRAINLNPDHAESFFYKCLINYYNYPNEAIKDCTQAIKLKPLYEQAYYIRGHIKLYNADYNSAIEDYNKAIKLKADYIEAYKDRSLAKTYIKNYSGAIEDLIKVKEIDTSLTKEIDTEIEKIKMRQSQK